jgi:hypothetical protein
MVNSSKRSTTSLELLISEIEATPREYWTELLETLRQFLQAIPSTTLPIIRHLQKL